MGLDELIAALQDVQTLLPDTVDEARETGYAAGRWSIADASLSPFLYLTKVLRNDAGVRTRFMTSHLVHTI
ncbi:hypothetical protein PENSPDRAFT_653415 [Peniophora sp. CONT]|nr:hypothetical protein PENSPDRAFT_653415 [Peniophora sp. CONT]